MWRLAADGAFAETTLLAAGHGSGMQGYRGGVEDHTIRVEDNGSEIQQNGSGVQDSQGSGVRSQRSGVRPSEPLHINSMTPSCVGNFLRK